MSGNQAPYCGVLYVGYGEKYLAEAIHSVKSLRTYHPELEAVLFTSADDAKERVEELMGVFHAVEIHPDIRRSYRDKILPLKQTPFQRTLFLDCDTELIGRVDDVFDLLGNYPLACCRDTTRYNLPAPGVPAVFSEPNTGVIAYESTPQVMQLFDLWLKRYDEGAERFEKDKGTLRGYHDQPSFREALYATAFPFYVLPDEYNLRVYAYWFAGAKVRILHAREPALTRWRHRINRNEDMRYGDGEPLFSRLLIETKRWIKEKVLGRRPLWLNKEKNNKDYSVPEPELKEQSLP